MFRLKVLTISLYWKDMVEPYYIKGVQKQPFTYVLQNRFFLKKIAKFKGKHLFWSHFLIKWHA